VMGLPQAFSRHQAPDIAIIMAASKIANPSSLPGLFDNREDCLNKWLVTQQRDNT